MRGTDGGRDVVPGFDESRVSDASATGTCIVNSAELSPAVPATSSIAGVYQPSVTRMIVFPDTRGASGPNAAGASANGRTAATFEVSRPSRGRWASSASWERSASTTKKIARPFSGWIVGGSAMVTSVPPARTSAVERCRISRRSRRTPHRPRRRPPRGPSLSPQTHRRQDRAHGLCRRPVRFRSPGSRPGGQAAQRSSRRRPRRHGSARSARRGGGRGRTAPAIHAHDDIVLGSLRIRHLRQGQPSRTSVTVADGDSLHNTFLSDGRASVPMGPVLATALRAV